MNRRTGGISTLHTKTTVLITIAHVIKKYKGNFCLARQKTIIDLMKKYHGVKIKRRMLNYHLHDLRSAGLIKTIKRAHRKKNGTLCLLSSATCITMKGYYRLGKMGLQWAYKQGKRLKKRYFNNIQHRKQENVKKGKEEKKLEKYIPLSLNPFKDPETREKLGINKIIMNATD